MSKNAPECPFCGRYIERPETRKTKFGEITYGVCNCGTVYVPDRTGRNTGEAYTEALFLMRDDFDIELLDPENDYDVADIDYDSARHLSATRIAKGKLVFVKKKARVPESSDNLKKEEAPAKEDNVKDSVSAFSADKGKLKEVVGSLLSRGAYDEIVEIAKQDKSVIRWIISFSYDKDDVVTWRAAEAIGKVTHQLSKKRMDVVRDTVRRLLWTMTEESGGIGWSSAEMIGEIIRNNPDDLSDIIPVLWSFRDEEMFRAGVVWAMCRIASVRPDLVRFITGDLRAMIKDNNPEVRGYSALAIGLLGDEDAVSDIKGLAGDNMTIRVYNSGELSKIAINELLKEILNKRLDKQDEQGK